MDKIKSWIDKHVIANGITVFEYIVWWIMRLALLVVLGYIFKIKFIDEGNFSIRIVQIAGCFLATFTVPIVRKLFFFIKPIKNMSLRMQTWINVTAFVASFFGQGLDFYHEIPTWDKIVHLFTGGIVVLIGNELVNSFSKKNERISPFNRTLASAGFSCFVIVIWENYEFLCDYFWEGSALQRYEPGDDYDHLDTLFVKFFGESVNNNRIEYADDGSIEAVVTNWQLFDTNVDMLYAMLCCIVTAIGLFTFYTIKEKKAEKKARLTEEDLEKIAA